MSIVCKFGKSDKIMNKSVAFFSFNFIHLFQNMPKLESSVVSLEVYKKKYINMIDI